jgi:hypothetical protein
MINIFKKISMVFSLFQICFNSAIIPSKSQLNVMKETALEELQDLCCTKIIWISSDNDLMLYNNKPCHYCGQNYKKK